MSEWVAIPPWPDDVPDLPGFGIGARVIHIEIAWPHRPEGGWTGTVVAWGRSTEQDTHWREQHERGIVTCKWGDQCDALVGCEGPVIRWDNQDPGDESLDWYPGQSMGAIEELPDVTVPDDVSELTG